MSREELIARKEAVRAELARTRRELEHAHSTIATASGLHQRFLKSRVARLESRADALMAEECRLRRLIDQSR